MKTTLEPSEEDENYTRTEWRRWKLHSNRVKKMKTSLEASEEDTIYHRERKQQKSLFVNQEANRLMDE